MPKTGGPPFSNVPRPGAPLSLRRRPGRLFFNGGGISLVSGHDMNLVHPDHARQGFPDRLGGQAPAQPWRHVPGIVPVQSQLPGDLAIRQVQPHEIKAQDPYPHRLVMAGQDRARQVIEPDATAVATITLAMRLGLIMPITDHRRAVTRGTTHTGRPAMLADQLKALRVINQR